MQARKPKTHKERKKHNLLKLETHSQAQECCLAPTRKKQLPSPHLETSLEGQLQLTAFDDDVGEVEEMHLEGVQHAFASHDDLLGLLLHRQ